MVVVGGDDVMDPVDDVVMVEESGVDVISDADASVSVAEGAVSDAVGARVASWLPGVFWPADVEGDTVTVRVRGVHVPDEDLLSAVVSPVSWEAVVVAASSAVVVVAASVAVAVSSAVVVAASVAEDAVAFPSAAPLSSPAPPPMVKDCLSSPELH